MVTTGGLATVNEITSYVYVDPLFLHFSPMTYRVDKTCFTVDEMEIDNK